MALNRVTTLDGECFVAEALTESKLRLISAGAVTEYRRLGLVDLSLVMSEATGSGRGRGRGRPAATGGRGRSRPVGRGVGSTHA